MLQALLTAVLFAVALIALTLWALADGFSAGDFLLLFVTSILLMLAVPVGLALPETIRSAHRRKRRS